MTNMELISKCQHVKLNEIKICNPKKTLFIIGNGFDIIHDIKSDYSDFRTWLKKNNCLLLHELETYIRYDALWYNFEEGLARIDISHILDYVDEGLKLFNAYDIDALAADYFLAAEFSTESYKTIIDDLHDSFRSWINSLILKTDKRPFEKILNHESMYLNFNYTEFIETLYRIPEYNICYIHGCRKNKSRKLILGHSLDADRGDSESEIHIPNYKSQRKLQMVYDAQETALSYIEDYDKEITKDTRENIKAHKNFFMVQSETFDVIVIGHSLSKVDSQYFIILQKIFNNRENVKWHITFHNNDDLVRIDNFLQIMRISPKQVELIEL